MLSYQFRKVCRFIDWEQPTKSPSLTLHDSLRSYKNCEQKQRVCLGNTSLNQHPQCYSWRQFQIFWAGAGQDVPHCRLRSRHPQRAGRGHRGPAGLPLLHRGPGDAGRARQRPGRQARATQRQVNTVLQFWHQYYAQLPWVRFRGPKIVVSSCTYLRLAQVMEVIIIDI